LAHILVPVIFVPMLTNQTSKRVNHKRGAHHYQKITLREVFLC